MMRKFVACSEGTRFVTGMPVDRLYEILMADKQPGSYFGLCNYRPLVKTLRDQPGSHVYGGFQ